MRGFLLAMHRHEDPIDKLRDSSLWQGAGFLNDLINGYWHGYEFAAFGGAGNSALGWRRAWILSSSAGKRSLLALEPLERAFGFVKLFIAEAGDCGSNAAFGLEASDFEDLALGFCFGTSGEVLADALAVEPARDPEDDIP